MNICNHCGVELDVEMNYCPLCGRKSNIPQVTESVKKKSSDSVNHETNSFDFNSLTVFQKQKIFWELSAIIIGSLILVTLFIDLFTNKQISWSKYIVTIGMVLFLNITMIVFLQKKLFLLLTGCFISTSLLLVLIDMFNNNLGWGLRLGIPIIFFIFVVLYFLIFFIQKSKQKGVNIIAYFLIAIGILGLCIDGIINLHSIETFRLKWSIYLLVSVLPVAGILFFIHYRIKKATDLKKFFHI